MKKKFPCLSKVQKLINIVGVPHYKLHTVLKVHQVQGPFFCHINAKPLTKYQFTSLLHKAVKFIGLDTSIFKSHSFRIGGATKNSLPVMALGQNFVRLWRMSSCIILIYLSYMKTYGRILLKPATDSVFFQVCGQ